MRHSLGRALPAAVLCASVLLVAACGLSSGGAQPTSDSTVVVNETPTTPTSLTAVTITPTAGFSTTATPAAVRLVLDKTSYAPGDIATVMIENGLSAQITVTDHQTNCGYTQLEQLIGGMWQPIGVCNLMTPTRMVELPAGSVTPQKISIPTGPNAAGTYRVMLTYFPVSGASSGKSGPAYSLTFTVS